MKPREFWLERHERLEVHLRDNGYAGETIHVIETSALESVKRELDEAKGDVDFHRGNAKIFSGLVDNRNEKIADLEASNEALKRELEKVEQENNWLTEANEAYKEKFGYTYCAYCNEKFDVDRPDLTAAIGAHIIDCEKHPTNHLAKLAKDLEAKLKLAVGAIDELLKSHFNLYKSAFGEDSDPEYDIVRVGAKETLSKLRGI